MAEAGFYLTADVQAVAAAGRATADTAGDWSAWSVGGTAAFSDAAAAVGNARLAAAVAEHAERWNPVIQRVAGQIESLGFRTSQAAVTVDDADLTGSQLLRTQTQTATGYGSTLLRPINGSVAV